MNICALMLTGKDFYATRAKACFETWLPTFDSFQIHSYTPDDYLPITIVGTGEGHGSCFDKRLEGLAKAPDADWYLCCSCDNYVWSDNLRETLKYLPTNEPVIVGETLLPNGEKFSLTLPNGSMVYFPSGGAGYCLNRMAMELIKGRLGSTKNGFDHVSSGNKCEDVFMGWVAEKLFIKVIENPAFHGANPNKGWQFKVPTDKAISLHWLNEDQIRTIHKTDPKNLAQVFTRKISLCMIAGNEQEIIVRCLESAKEAFDELCLVTATGSITPDMTARKAMDWCQGNGKEFRHKYYQNKIDFPHVDDFGEARNKSFEMATGDWILWLDCDDYLDPINCARMREAIMVVGEEVDAIFGSYLVEKQGGIIFRERLIRRGKGRWKNPIHETCVVPGMKIHCPQIQVFHGDHSHKHLSSAQRNANVLRRTIEDAPRHYFYLHCELKMIGDAQAIGCGRAALALLTPEMQDERYVVLLNMSELEPKMRDAHLMQAARIFPHRREAFAYLCKSALIDGRLSDAKSWFRLMDALPLPDPLPWTHQALWYGWGRHQMRIDILRACGQVEQADKEHAHHMKDPEYAEHAGNVDTKA